MSNDITYCTLNMFVLALISFVFYIVFNSWVRWVGFAIALVGYMVLHRFFKKFDFWLSYMYSMFFYAFFFIVFFYVNGAW